MAGAAHRLLVLLSLVVILAATALVAPGRDSAAADTTPSGPTVSVGTSFDGAARVNAGPPNTQVAVGPTHIVELTNNALDIWARTSPVQHVFREFDCTLFGLPSCTDPRVMYDAHSGRFFASIMNDSSFVVAVSATADPTGPWYCQTVAVPRDSIDMPRLAVTTDKVIVGDNGPDIWVFEKSDFLAATADPVAARMVHLTNGNATVGVINLEVGNPNGPIGYAVALGGTDTTAALITQITGTPAAGDVALIPTVVHLPYPWQDPIAAPEQGGPNQIPDDFYPKQGILSGGSLWFPMDEPCVPAGDTQLRDCVHLAQVDISSTKPFLVREPEIAVPGRYLITPAVAVDAQGRAVVVATETGTDMYPSVIAIPIRADGTVGSPSILRAGQSYSDADNYAPNLIRWGDYSSAAVDPTDPSRLWLGGEFALNPSQWGTSISSVTVTDPGCPQVSSCQPGSYHPVPLARVLDTRIGLGAPQYPVRPGDVLRLPVTGLAGVPADGVGAVALTVTVTDPTSSGHVTVYPDTGSVDGQPTPTTSNLNFVRAQTTADLVVVPVAPDGSIDLAAVTTGGSVQLVADLAGYYLAGQAVAAGAFTPLAPARLLDTRIGTGAPKRAVPNHGILRLPVTGVAGVPASGVSAVAVTVTVTDPASAGNVSVYPDADSTPGTSNLNFAHAQTAADLVVVPVGPDGRIDLRATTTGGSVQLIADLAGYYLAGQPTATGAFTPLAPTRLLDTRTGTGAPAQPVANHATLRLPVTGLAGVPASGVSAVAVTVTVTNPHSPGNISVYPDGDPPPATSNLNFTRAQTTADLVIVPVGPDATIDLTSTTTGGTVDLIADIAGYYLN